MSTYTGQSVTIARPIQHVWDRVSDLTQYRDMVEQLPADVRARMQGVEFQGDAIKMDAPGVGQLVFKATSRTAPTRVTFEAQGSPIPLTLAVDLAELSADETSITPSIDINIPPMLRPFIGGKLQQAADQLGSLFTTVFSQPQA